MAKKAGRKPDYRLKVLDKSTEQRGEVGAAWLNPNDDSITIVLNPCVMITSNPNQVLTLFSNDRLKGNEE